MAFETLNALRNALMGRRQDPDDLDYRSQKVIEEQGMPEWFNKIASPSQKDISLPQRQAWLNAYGPDPKAGRIDTLRGNRRGHVILRPAGSRAKQIEAQSLYQRIAIQSCLNHIITKRFHSARWHGRILQSRQQPQI